LVVVEAATVVIDRANIVEVVAVTEVNDIQNEKTRLLEQKITQENFFGGNPSGIVNSFEITDAYVFHRL
jgi:hypothetical protein